MPGASAAQLDRLAAAYQESLTRLASAGEFATEQSWRTLSGFTDGEVQSWLTRTGRTTMAARDTASRLAANFFDSYVAAATGELATLDPIDFDRVVARVRAGYGPETMYAEPIGRARRMVSQGAKVSAAIDETAPKVGQIADQDVMLSAREGAMAANDRHDIRRFARRPEPGACQFCRTAAEQVYKRVDLRPIHGHCHCVTVPLVGAAQPDPEG